MFHASVSVGLNDLLHEEIFFQLYSHILNIIKWELRRIDECILLSHPKQKKVRLSLPGMALVILDLCIKENRDIQASLLLFESKPCMLFTSNTGHLGPRT